MSGNFDNNGGWDGECESLLRELEKMFYELAILGVQVLGTELGFLHQSSDLNDGAQKDIQGTQFLTSKQYLYAKSATMEL